MALHDSEQVMYTLLEGLPMNEIAEISSTVMPRMKWDYEKERTGYDDLLSLGTADMDFKSPQPVLDSILAIVQNGHLGYPYIPEAFYDAIQEHFMRISSWKIDAKKCVAVNVGIYMAAWNVFDCLTSPGDKIVILTPVHFCFKHIITMNQRKAIECPLLLEDNQYRIDFDGLRACLESGAKMLWICNPHNPVGRSWTVEELEKIADLCVKYDVLIMSDDVYCDLLFPGTKYTPIASLSKDVSYRTVTLYSTSKSYNTTGLRFSFVVAENPQFFEKYQYSLAKCDLNYGINIMGIAATIAAYTSCNEWTEQLMEQISANHRLVSEYCAAHIPDINVIHADSTYFAWIDMRRLNVKSQQLAYLLEEEEHMIVENGEVFGKGGKGFIRVNLGTSFINLEDALKRLKHFCLNHCKQEEEII